MDNNQISRTTETFMYVREVEKKRTANGRTPAQMKAWDYFWRIAKVKDYEYDQLVAKKLKQDDFKQRALDFCGIEESQVQEVTPLNINSYEFDGEYFFCKQGSDGLVRTSSYAIVWIFGGQKQLYVYKYRFNLHTFEKEEVCYEYFYKDITNLSTGVKVKDEIYVPKDKSKLIMGIVFLVIGLSSFSFAIFELAMLIMPIIFVIIGIVMLVMYLKNNKPKVQCVLYNFLDIQAKGAVSFHATMLANDDAERGINGLKAKWREKKNM